MTLPTNCVILLISLLATTTMTTASNAAERLALVIGNSNYVNAPPLRNPVNDAQDVAAALRRLNFRVLEHTDLNRLEMEQAISDFGRQAEQADFATVFYAGHGVQVEGINYLLPIDAPMLTETRQLHGLIPVDDVVEEASWARSVAVVILDACRDNPLTTTLASERSAAVGRGLARVDAPMNTLIAFATQENSVAEDGTGRNSPYTQALLQHLETPELEIRFLFGEVRDTVVQTTLGKQQPAEYTSLGGERFYFAHLSQNPAPVATARLIRPPTSVTRNPPAAVTLSTARRSDTGVQTADSGTWLVALRQGNDFYYHCHSQNLNGIALYLEGAPNHSGWSDPIHPTICDGRHIYIFSIDKANWGSPNKGFCFQPGVLVSDDQHVAPRWDAQLLTPQGMPNTTLLGDAFLHGGVTEFCFPIREQDDPSPGMSDRGGLAIDLYAERGCHDFPWSAAGSSLQDGQVGAQSERHDDYGFKVKVVQHRNGTIYPLNCWYQDRPATTEQLNRDYAMDGRFVEVNGRWHYLER